MDNERTIEVSPAAERPKAILEPHSKRRISRIAQHTDARSYLEIGVFKGKTFNALNFPYQVAVDPSFGFNPEEFRRDGVEFVAKTSDKFFVTRDRSRTFDIVFLDGLHNFQQTFRDFCNSLTCSHARTVWLIDDILPSDVYSSLPISSDARGFRRRAGGNSAAWHGDVYKVVFMIHDFFPTLSYVCVSTAGNPQAIVWHAPRTEFAPVLGTVEAVERLDYFNLLKRESVLNLMPEPQAFEHFFASMPGKLSPKPADEVSA